MPPIPYRLGVIQRVLPAYRVPFFDGLARACAGGLGLVSRAAARRMNSSKRAARRKRRVYSRPTTSTCCAGPLYVCRQAGVRAWLEEWQPDVLVVEANPRYLSTPGAVRWMHAPSRPVIGWGLGAPAPRGLLAGLRARGAAGIPGPV